MKQAAGLKTQERWITRSEIIVYVLLSLLDFLCKLFGNALTWGALCSGTGTGGNRATLRLCQDDAVLFYPLVLDLALLLCVLLIFRVFKLRRGYRMVFAVLYLLFILIGSLVVWNIPFFTERIR